MDAVDGFPARDMGMPAQDHIAGAHIAAPVCLQANRERLAQSSLLISHLGSIVLIHLAARHDHIFLKNAVHDAAQNLQFTADIVVAAAAGIALAAVGDRLKHNTCAGLQVGNTLAHCDHLTGTLVAKHHRILCIRVAAMIDMHIRTADAGSVHLDEHSGMGRSTSCISPGPFTTIAFIIMFPFPKLQIPGQDRKPPSTAMTWPVM